MEFSQKIRNSDLFSPLARGTKCRVAFKFTGDDVGNHELAVQRGDILVLLEPSERLYWYKARRQSDGASGLVPVTHLQFSSSGVKRMKLGQNGYEDDDGPDVLDDDIDDDDDDDDGDDAFGEDDDDAYEEVENIREPRQQAAARRRRQRRKEPFFKSYEMFKKNSGWFTTGSGVPANESMLTSALEKKARLQSLSLAENLPAVYTFEHKRVRGKKFIGYAKESQNELVQMFKGLYSKKVQRMNGIEREILFESPCAVDWELYIEIEPKKSIKDMGWKTQLNILKENSLQGTGKKGLNDALTFTSATEWQKFRDEFVKSQRKPTLPPQKSVAHSAGRPPLPERGPPPLPPLNTKPKLLNQMYKSTIRYS